MKKPNAHLGMRHIALNVINITACKYFYVELLHMTLAWQPDAENVYLTSGTDNLALHTLKDADHFNQPQHLDHLGFFLKTREDVDQWYDYLRAHDVEMKAAPKDHRDGTRSFYCADPEGNIVQMIYYPLPG
ncbi:MAG: VOC family protein [Gammaproteobacteria bacterium]|nr:VOC family protein [Gammaproteobacteria bacterium]